MKFHKLILVLFVFLLFPSIAYANAIIPYMIVPIGQLFLLPIVIIMEAFIVQRFLKIKALRTLWVTLVGNIISTMIGAVLYFGVFPFFGKTAWDFYMKSETFGTIIVSIMLASILFVISWLSESYFAQFVIKEREKAIVTKSYLWANVATYTTLVVFSILSI